MTHAAVDTDYLYLSARVRAMERRLLSRAQAERMLEAPTAEAAAGVLQECGYEELPRLSEQSLEDALAARRREIFRALYRASPERRIIDVFRAPYDYQNVKALLKAEAAGADPAPLLTDAGRVCPAELREAMRSADLRGLPPPLQRAAAAGRDDAYFVWRLLSPNILSGAGHTIGERWGRRGMPPHPEKQGVFRCPRY